MSLFKELVDRISPLTKRYVERQVGFAATVAEKLRLTGMTQRELADILKKKESYISRILSGDANPTLKTISELEVAVGEDIITFNLQCKTDQKNRVFMMVEPFMDDLIEKKGQVKYTASSGVTLSPAIEEYRTCLVFNDQVEAA